MLRMMIADDESAIRKGLEKLVQSFSLGIEIVGVAADGEQALALALQKKPELMLIDINMPKLNGLDLIEKLKQALPESRIIILTGYDQFDYTRRALKLGVFDYLLKPINHGLLRTTLQEAIDGIEQKPKPAPPESEDVIGLALEQIEMRYGDENLRLAVLADELYISNASLSRGIKQRTGKTFSEYLTDLRMQHAIDMMTSSRVVTIYTVAEQVGYSSQHYFCRIFKEYTGSTPSEYIRRHRERQRQSLQTNAQRKRENG